MEITKTLETVARQIAEKPEATNDPIYCVEWKY